MNKDIIQSKNINIPCLYCSFGLRTFANYDVFVCCSLALIDPIDIKCPWSDPRAFSFDIIVVK